MANNNDDAVAKPDFTFETSSKKCYYDIGRMAINVNNR